MKLGKAILQVADMYEWDVRTDYSGRCMYGKQCIGIVTDDCMATLVDLMMSLMQMLKDNEDECDFTFDDLSDLRDACTDNMAMDYILYFPYISANEEV